MSALDDLVLDELNKHDKLLKAYVVACVPFTYLDYISTRFNVDSEGVINHALDMFNWYMRNNVDETQAMYMSLYKTHEHLALTYLKEE